MNSIITAKELKEHELMSALSESERDIRNGKYTNSSIVEHMKSVGKK